MKAVLVVHGGAWAIPDELADASVKGVKAAASEGYRVLGTGGSALDAVEKAVRAMEDNPVFDAGHGAVLNADGEVELDAIIMDGQTLGSGAVACVQNIANPVSLARAVMEKTDHVMLTSRGANLFAERIGFKTAPTETLVTAYERREWEKAKEYGAGVKELFHSQLCHDTVGAVAVDSCGNVACATSTGGIRNKMALGDTRTTVAAQCLAPVTESPSLKSLWLASSFSTLSKVKKWRPRWSSLCATWTSVSMAGAGPSRSLPRGSGRPPSPPRGWPGQPRSKALCGTG
ncbi:isoaspartyl peptidase/L-asparaginase isoform X2 [Gadus macrocephalus]|uniref:isoaspartyl peptidase/L-asparaginase isoform X2 n=1 Tax=Gadus macrocephalus TaxID=80720 RepID=UPI0028CB9047|nr:isoaspartyl peptidase/L-asparaginase isoform X2 [Gadus macrocephalus]